jgi:hypothetical protein
MGWKALPERDVHVDCLAEPVAQYLREFRVPGLTGNMLSFSAEIRAGQRDRHSALKALEKERRPTDAPKELDYFLTRVGLTSEEFQSYTNDPFRHMRFQNPGPVPRLLNRILPA